MRKVLTVVVFGVVLAGSLAGPLSAQVGQRGQAGGRTGGMRMGQGAGMESQRQAQQAKVQAFLAQEETAGKTFMAGLAGKGKGEKLPAIKAFKTEQYQKNCAFRETMVAEHRAAVEARFQANPMAPADFKAKMLARMAAEFEANKAFFAQKHQENMAFLDKVAADPQLDGPALDKALTEFFQAQKAAAQAYINERKQANQQQGGPARP